MGIPETASEGEGLWLHCICLVSLGLWFCPFCLSRGSRSSWTNFLESLSPRQARITALVAHCPEETIHFILRLPPQALLKHTVELLVQVPLPTESEPCQSFQSLRVATYLKPATY